ncbi:MAG: tetratricopeptide repeat protein [Alphaproteobacteria bacterium]|jgi:predicted O-linked N-acetylglucosamine transferase (SPINDLY family)|nr:tetratricopeptide repeat protein [Alphaproteobacteria bacterium]
MNRADRRRQQKLASKGRFKPGDDLRPALEQAAEWHRAGRLAQAAGNYERILAADPHQADVLHLLATILHDQGDGERAVELSGRAAALQPANPDYLNMLGTALITLGRLEEAEAHFRQALAAAPAGAESHSNLGLVLRRQGRLLEAEESLRRALELTPGAPEILNNLGVTLLDRGLAVPAVAIFTQVLEREPGYAAAHNNLGLALLESGDSAGAISQMRQAIGLDPELADAHSNLGSTLLGEGQLDGAAEHIEKALALMPGDVQAEAVALRHGLFSCQWARIGKLAASVGRATDASLRAGRRPPESPFLSVIRDPNPQRNLAIARAWSADLSRRSAAVPSARKDPTGSDRPGSARIVVGYLSNDFYEHATARLITGLLETHDGQQFDIRAYSYGPDDGSELRHRIKAACADFVDLRALDDVDAARRIADDGVDILVDLKGHTRGGRLGICAWRPAPLQLTWLGFPGSSGSDFFDYLIADVSVAPADEAEMFSETLAYLPDCYQVTDGGRQVPGPPASALRADLGLPDEGVVFCCFNQTYKIEAAMFATWMKVLAALPGSMLWLLDGGRTCRENLSAAVRDAGVDPGRLLFAPKAGQEQHLGRLTAADLAFDTFPCNGHTTTSDALWAGVPVVTLAGRHFASRVSESLLRAVEMPELVAADLAAYGELAIALAADGERLAACRAKLAEKRTTAPLFDTPRFARNLEALYRQAWQRHVAGQSPTPLIVPAP